MKECFVSEPIRPVADTHDAAAMARGEPGLPARFVWRECEYTVARVVGQWKDTRNCRSGSAERYVRRHWYEIVTQEGIEMRLYCERHGKGAYWHVYTIAHDEREESRP